MKKVKALRIILGDQLSLSMSSLKHIDKQHDMVLMMEVYDEASYVPHHKQKLILFFAAMRQFSTTLAKTVKVKYIEIDSDENQSSFTATLEKVLQSITPEKIIITHPGEYRVLSMVKSWQKQFSIPVEILADTRFIASLEEFSEFAKDKKSLRMEYFYRQLRIKTGLLMQDSHPAGGQWNFDHENRKRLPKEHSLPAIKTFKPNKITQQVIHLVNRLFPTSFGASEPFEYATTRRQALVVLDDFINNRLCHFGDYQDAMKVGEYHLYHSILSQYLNIGLLLPIEVCQRAEQAWQHELVPLNAAEGFIRQILGWREFVRGIYWHYMPNYTASNYFNAKQALPDFYWTAETKMACVKQVVEQTQQTAQSHHIQRLMVTGNFALLYGVEPKLVCDWYLAVYLDAIEWVELPNTFGMALYADGGKMASKPYIASGKYIDKMSDFCQRCHYDVKSRDKERSCPFNVFYWDFLIKHQNKLKTNNRMSLALSHLNKMTDSDKQTIKNRACQLRRQKL